LGPCYFCWLSLSQHGSSGPDISTSAAASTLDNIGVIFSESLRRELIEFELEDEKLGLKATGYCSNANFSAKKGTFLLFINREHLHTRVYALLPFPLT
jgi:DNA mismatch repair protein MLH1